MDRQTRRQVAKALRIAAAVLKAAGPTDAQVRYALHLLKQQGLSEPTEEQVRQMDPGTISGLIDDLKKKRGRARWYGDGKFAGWEK